MAQRHPHDSVTTELWPGATTPGDPRFVPIALRDLVAGIPPDVEATLRRELYNTKEIVRVLDRGQAVTLHPATDVDDLETGLVWARCEWARRQLARDEERQASIERDRLQRTCGLCRRVDSSVSNVLASRRWCQRCLDELHRQEVEAHAARKVNGKSVGELIRQHLLQQTADRKAATP